MLPRQRGQAPERGTKPLGWKELASHGGDGAPGSPENHQTLLQTSPRRNPSGSPDRFGRGSSGGRAGVLELAMVMLNELTSSGITEQARDTAERLSAANIRFLDYAEKHPKLLEKKTFARVNEKPGGYPAFRSPRGGLTFLGAAAQAELQSGQLRNHAAHYGDAEACFRSGSRGDRNLLRDRGFRGGDDYTAFGRASCRRRFAIAGRLLFYRNPVFSVWNVT